MNRRFLFILMAFSLVLSSCFGNKEQEEHFSNEGLILEAYLPGDIGMLLSYSSRDDEQFQYLQDLKSGMSGDVDQTLAESFSTQFGDSGVDFEKDLMPAFGERFRMVYAAKSGDTTTSYTVVTLEDPDQMTKVLNKLVESGQLQSKKLTEVEAFVNEENMVYTSVYKDLLFITNSPEALMGMVSQDEDSSLWSLESYQEGLDNMGSNYVFYGVIYPQLYQENVTVPVSLGGGEMLSILDRQWIVFRAEDGGLSFDAWSTANKEKAKESGISFDRVPRSEPYLYKEMPDTGLIAYVESFGLKQSIEEAGKVDSASASLEQTRATIRDYFGMDLDTEILSFLDKGFAIAMNGSTGGIIPSFSILVDVSSDTANAKTFVDKVDGQLSGLMIILESALPGAVLKDNVTWDGEKLNRLSIDLSALPRSEESPLPVALTNETIQLVYGLMGDRLILSTTDDWDTGLTVNESDLYNELAAKVEGLNEGLILVDTQELVTFIDSISSLRDQLGLQSDSGIMQFQDFLRGFAGLIGQGETKAYESHFGGFLKMAN